MALPPSYGGSPENPKLNAWNYSGSVTHRQNSLIIQNEFGGAVIKDTDDEENERQRTGCCSCFSQCSQETSFSGIKYIGGNDNGTIRRSFWLIVVLLASAGLSFQLYRSCEKFVNRETNTKIKYVTMPELDFPSVTFCNSNMFRLTKLAEYYGGFFNVFNVGLIEVRQLFPEPGITSLSSDDSLNITTYPGSQDLYDFIVNSAHQKESMIYLCQYNGVPCGPDNFTTTVTNFGVCFTFNSIENDKKLTVTTPGKTQGLSLILNAGVTDVVAAPRENVGFKMLVHPRNEFPNLDDFGIELEPGTHTPIRLGVTDMISLGAPYGDCGTTPLKYFDTEYTETKCYLECETDYIIEKCGCQNFYMPGNASFCSPTQLVNCFYNEKVNFDGNRDNLCKCPDACNERTFNPSMSQSSFPSSGVALTMLTREDHTVLAASFGEAVSESASGQMSVIYESMYYGVIGTIQILMNENGTLFTDLYPWSQYTIAEHIMNDIFGNIQFDLFLGLPNNVYDELLIPNSNYTMAPGSARYWSAHAHFTDKYITSGVYKQSFANALLDYGVSPNGMNGQSFEELVDSLYEDFYLEVGFYLAFGSIYNETYTLIIQQANYVSSTSDLTAIATDFMSANLVHLDIFYGDLKVELIEEQPSYEVFQFICDIGGALGLFFGASLLSFIETVDFWFTREGGFFGAPKKRNNSMTKNKIDIQPEIISVS